MNNIYINLKIFRLYSFTIMLQVDNKLQYIKYKLTSTYKT